MSASSARTREIVRFLGVGSVGFVIDAGALVALVHAGYSPFGARVVSFALAVTATWWLNRTWTFRRRAHRANGREFVAYVCVQCGGLALNYAVFAAVLLALGPTPADALPAVAAGSAAALAWNYLGLRRVVFGARSAA
jgi:putative flippase GtrA